MARLHEYQAKELLRRKGVATPGGFVVRRGEERPNRLPAPAVVKAQAWTTGRLEQGLIRFCDTADQAWDAARELLGREVSGFPVDAVLIEERIPIEEEFFFSYFVEDETGLGKYLFAATGGSGVEESLRVRPESVLTDSVEPWKPLRVHRIREAIRQTGVHGSNLVGLSDLVFRAIGVAVASEARSLEINPVVRTRQGEFVAADCRMTVDDYAVFRHPELGIEIARDLANPPTDLDRVAYEVEADDYRGTFFFTQLVRGFEASERYVGFHGAGGGGSMMSMDALTKRGFHAANYCDTSGNPPASKVYRAARLILAQPNIVGYFGSGSGVASQEQIHSARGLVKAFLEVNLAIPAVVRLGGNMEREAIHVLEKYTGSVAGTVRAFGKDTSAAACAGVLETLVTQAHAVGKTQVFSRPEWFTNDATYTFVSPTGTVAFYHPTCLECTTKACVEACVPRILTLVSGRPELAISREAARAGKCIECLACEVECGEHGAGGGYVDLPIPGLEDVNP